VKDLSRNSMVDSKYTQDILQAISAVAKSESVGDLAALAEAVVALLEVRTTTAANPP
jgi:hypothetical protein